MATSCPRLPLPAELVREIREHKLASTHKAPDDLVFATSSGKPHSPSNLTSRGWKPVLRWAEVRERAFHTLRHTYASALIRNNVSMKVVSHLCGHSSIGITMDTYAHLLPDSTDGVAEAVSGTMLGASGSKTVAAGL
jgi:integrase